MMVYKISLQCIWPSCSWIYDLQSHYH